MLIAGQECEYDTLVHRKIGPGATYTQFQFNSLNYQGGIYKMRGHVIQIDMTNPYNDVKTYLSKDEYYKVNTQAQQVKIEKQKGLKPLASVNYPNSRTQSNGVTSVRKAYEVMNTYVIGSEIKYQGLGSHYNYFMDSNKCSHFGNVTFVGNIVANNTSILLGQVNHCRDLTTSAQKYATLFCNGMNISFAADNTIGVDVVIEKTDGTSFTLGQNKCRVVDVLEGCGHHIESGEAIISGVGDVGTSLKQLTVGQEIEVSMNYTDDSGNVLDILHQCSCDFGSSIIEGSVHITGRKNAARPNIGCSKDGKTLFLSDIEISPYSNAPQDCLSYLLKNLGIYNAYWMDGGLSAEMTVDGEFVTINSIGYGFNGRYIPGGVMLYSIAPDDGNITKIELSDPTARSMYVGQTLDIPTYAYNQYGEMIQKDAEKTNKIELTCSNDLGTFSNGVFTATKTGEGVITIKVAGTNIIKTIPVTVSEHRVFTANPKNLFTGEGRECQLTLSLTDSEGMHEIKPEDAVWTTNSKYVITGCANGRIVPMVDGKADVYVTYDGLCDTVNVTVENLEQEVGYLGLTDDVEDKKSPDIQLPSVPHSFTASIKGEPGSIVPLYYTLCSGYVCPQPDTIAEDSTVSIHVNLDYDGLTTYPVNIINLTSSSKTDAPTLTGLIAYYTADVDGINEITTDLPSSSCIHSIYSLTGQRLSQIQKGINLINRRKYIVKR